MLPSKTPTRYAVKVYYDGRGYFGFQPQKGLPTVGGTILDALKASGLVEDPSRAGLQAASRTDRGVSALGQTVSFTTWERFTLGRLNAYLPEDIQAWAWAKVPLNFNPRKEALRRRYLYVAPHQGEDLKCMVEASSLFTSEKTLEFGFKPLESIRISLNRGFISLTFTSKSFTRGLVRRLTTILLKAGREKLKLESLYSLLRGEGFKRFSSPPAPAHSLTLLEAEYNLPFQVDEEAYGRLREKLAWEASRLEALRSCLKLLEERGTYFLAGEAQ